MKPETGVQPWDAKHKSSEDTGVARLQYPQDPERGARVSDSPQLKFSRVWPEIKDSRGGR